MSYDGRLGFGLLGDYDALPDLDEIAARPRALDRRAGRGGGRDHPAPARAPPAREPAHGASGGLSGQAARGRSRRRAGGRRPGRAAAGLQRARRRAGQPDRGSRRAAARQGRAPSAARASTSRAPGSPTRRPAAPHHERLVTRDRRSLTPDEILHALELGNVIVFYGAARPPAALRALQDDVSGPFDAEVAAAGQQVILARRPEPARPPAPRGGTCCAPRTRRTRGCASSPRRGCGRGAAGPATATPPPLGPDQWWTGCSRAAIVIRTQRAQRGPASSVMSTSQTHVVRAAVAAAGVGVDRALGDRAHEARLVGLAHGHLAVARHRVVGGGRGDRLGDRGVDAAVHQPGGLEDLVADGDLGAGLLVGDADELEAVEAVEAGEVLGGDVHRARATIDGLHLARFLGRSTTLSAAVSPLQALAPDQRAILELLLRQGRSYGELSELLGLPEAGVRSRAHAALEALVPDRAAPVGEDGAVADWLLGQQEDGESERTPRVGRRHPGLARVGGRGRRAGSARSTARPCPTCPRRPSGRRRAARPGAKRPPAAARRRRPRPVQRAEPARPVRAAEPAPPGSASRRRRRLAALLAARRRGADRRARRARRRRAVHALRPRRRRRRADRLDGAKATATATATATPQVVSEVVLQGVGSKAQGLMRVFKRDTDGKLVFALAADKVPPTGRRRSTPSGSPRRARRRATSASRRPR